ncbi:hypothetical protein MMAN_22100 [Mycobacterium mantenii]|uniref:DUF222 domain-containing protein n=1 Tax=Mycobacterium mantenii TaxID=560555 RepID=A0ABN6A9C3_MYCNT|nr:hypothetical protein MMAN_22100 [Mycobacterium mantenii]
MAGTATSCSKTCGMVVEAENGNRGSGGRTVGTLSPVHVTLQQAAQLMALLHRERTLEFLLDPPHLRHGVF